MNDGPDHRSLRSLSLSLFPFSFPPLMPSRSVTGDQWERDVEGMRGEEEMSEGKREV